MFRRGLGLLDYFSIPAIEAARAGRLIGRRLVYLPETVSTNEVAKGLARQGEAEGTVVLADKQTGGKGRLGRSWTAPAGSSILLSIILRPTAAQLPRLTMVAALAAARAVEGATGLPAMIKWPNDIIIRGKKAGGILLEAELTGEAPSFAVAGIGLNVNFDTHLVPEIPELATSISLELGREYHRQKLLLSLLEEFEPIYIALRAEVPIQEEWRSRLETIGRWVTVTSMGGRTDVGQAEDVDDQGRLIIRHADGSVAIVSEGDVSLR